MRAALLVLATVAALAAARGTTEYLPGSTPGTTRLVHRVSMRTEGASSLSGKISAGAGAAGVVGDPTNPPVEQPHKIFVMLSSYCKAATVFNLQSSNITNSGWKHAPPASVPSARSGQIIQGFEAEAYPGGVDIQAQANYYTADNNWFVLTAFGAAQGVWEMSVEYKTVMGVQIQQSDIGHAVVYNLVAADPKATEPVC